MTTAIRLFLDVVGDVILTCRDVVVSGKQVANLHKSIHYLDHEKGIYTKLWNAWLSDGDLKSLIGSDIKSCQLLFPKKGMFVTNLVLILGAVDDPHYHVQNEPTQKAIGCLLLPFKMSS